LRLYKLGDINIAPDRQRQEFNPEALEELKNSILDRGLMHAIVVRAGADGQPVLVAGERRLRAMTDIYALEGVVRYNGQALGFGMIPTVTLGELDPLEAEEAELDENIKRKNLTWQEEAAAHKRLHELRTRQKAKLPGAPAQTVAETAAELYPKEIAAQREAGQSGGYLQNKVQKELIVAQHLSNPEVAKAKNVDEAYKVLKRSEQAQRNRDLALEVGKSFGADVHNAFQGNCLTKMAELFEDDQRFDVILTDPPYGMNAQNFGDGAGKLAGIKHQYDDTPEAWRELMKEWCKWSFFISKSQAHAYVFCDIDRFHELKMFMELAGWRVHRTPLIDYKTDSGRVPWPDCGPRRQWEMILYAVKGDKPVTNIYPDVIPCQADPNMTHGAQKPVALYVNLLKRSVKPGDAVLDTFAGSGTIFPAAHSLQCRATGIEQEPEYFGMCLNRLKELKAATGDMESLMEGLK
jgi:ParB/RepB/Spo0J family partition protein